MKKITNFITKEMASAILKKNKEYIMWKDDTNISIDKLVSDFRIDINEDGEYFLTHHHDDFYIHDIIVPDYVWRNDIKVNLADQTIGVFNEKNQSWEWTDFREQNISPDNTPDEIIEWLFEKDSNFQTPTRIDVSFVEIDFGYFGYSSIEELKEKIVQYLSEYWAWDYDNDCWACQGFPSWTFSGLNRDSLTVFVQNYIETFYDDGISFDGEEDRISQIEIIASAMIEYVKEV